MARRVYSLSRQEKAFSGTKGNLFLYLILSEGIGKSLKALLPESCYDVDLVHSFYPLPVVDQRQSLDSTMNELPYHDRDGLVIIRK
jgi:hypothetical protein